MQSSDLFKLIIPKFALFIKKLCSAICKQRIQIQPVITPGNAKILNYNLIQLNIAYFTLFAKANVDSVFELEYDNIAPLIKMLYAFCYLADTVRCVTDNAFCQNYRLYLTLTGLVDQ